MCSWRELPAALVALLLAAGASAQGTGYPGIGRDATAAEVAAWDIDVRPDFKGLPKGAGSVADGMKVWEARCASCHGVFGESNEVFAPLIGGTTKDDAKTGRVASLTDASFPGRTTMMKLSTVSTLWDYIHRAMPWNAPKSLSTQEVYGVTAYMLNMAGVLADGFVLSDANIAEVQKLLPNRNGVTRDHGLWPGKGMGNGGRPDVKALACMTNCATEPKVASLIPDHARGAHGNLAEQNRRVGPQRGVDTAPASRAAGEVNAPADPAAGADALALLSRHSCTACHSQEGKLLGPALRDVARRYAGRSDAPSYLAMKIQSGGTGVWGAVPMPPQALPAEDARTIARWIAEGASR